MTTNDTVSYSVALLFDMPVRERFCSERWLLSKKNTVYNYCANKAFKYLNTHRRAHTHMHTVTQTHTHSDTQNKNEK